jgi:hypothetical protein
MKRLGILEEILLTSGDYPYFASTIRRMKKGVAIYSEPIRVLQRLASARKLLNRTMAIEDELSQAIIGILAVRGALNISQITEEVRSARGRASRRIVRERLKRLEEDRVVRRVEGWGHRYEIVG